MNIIAQAMPHVSNWPEAFAFAVVAVCGAACIIVLIVKS